MLLEMFVTGGDAMVFYPHGTVLFHVPDRDVIHTLDPDAAGQEAHRQNFPAWRDADTVSMGGASVVE